MQISSDVRKALAETNMPEDLTFGKAILPVIAAMEYRDGAWGKPALVLDSEYFISSGSTVIQYAQSCFEGMKAFWINQEQPALFRGRDHAARFQRSANRMCMPEVPEELFLECVEGIVSAYSHMIPRKPDHSLYVRPCLFGDERSLVVGPSETFAMTVHVGPTIPFSTEMKSVLIERDDTRAALGGTGHVKAAGNYAASFTSLKRAQALNCATSLWLDPVERKYIEELSLMNLFSVVDGELFTPALNGSFLPGWTRDSILKMANHLSIKVCEERLAIDELITWIRNGTCTEIFSCGTAAVISPIRSLKEQDGTEYIVAEQVGPITSSLRNNIVAIQEGRSKDIFGWMTPVKPAS